MIGWLYAFVYQISRQQILAFSLAGWLKLALLCLAFWGLLRGWPAIPLLAPVAAALFFHLLVWWIGRQGYVYFMAATRPAPGDAPSLADNEQVSLRVTGLLATKDREVYLLNRPAQYWRVPLGEHIFMAEHEPGRYLYQFVRRETLRSVKAGRLLFGSQPQETLAVEFWASWGPAFANLEDAYYVSQEKEFPQIKRVLYLAFDRSEQRDIVWRNLIRKTRSHDRRGS